MNTKERILNRARQVLTVLIAQIPSRVPSALGSVSEHVVHGVDMVCASFLKSKTADTLDLCVEVEEKDGQVSVFADLVRGGSGEILSEMTRIVISMDSDMETAVNLLEQYLRNQEDAIADGLR
jgi:hypothetical protein